jgi:hypothetical protein
VSHPAVSKSHFELVAFAKKRRKNPFSGNNFPSERKIRNRSATSKCSGCDASLSFSLSSRAPRSPTGRRQSHITPFLFIISPKRKPVVAATMHGASLARFFDRKITSPSDRLVVGAFSRRSLRANRGPHADCRCFSEFTSPVHYAPVPSRPKSSVALRPSAHDIKSSEVCRNEMIPMSSPAKWIFAATDALIFVRAS